MNVDNRKWDRIRAKGMSYEPGTRILLMHMGDDPRPIPDGTRGTVEFVDDIGTVFCTFDNGRQLGLVPEEDSFRRLSQRELEAENHY